MDTPSPADQLGRRHDVLLAYLRSFRAQLIAQVGELSAENQRRAMVSSGWTALELLQHLTFVEMRWLEWGLEGRAIDDPWGDQRDGRWRVEDTDTYDSLVTRLREQGVRSDAIIQNHQLQDVAPSGPRWLPGERPASLERILMHLLQEYARHLGHLDIICELAAPISENELPGGGLPEGS